MIDTRTVSAIDIADELGLPRPTPQQIAVIEAPLEPVLVVAGAGSGKTETMANRVLWLLANGRVGPAEVLGLTFTRKAAGELASRIRERIGQLAARGLVPGYDPFEAPTVATYNSFANAIYRDNALLLGRESDGTVLGPAAAWQLARSIVVASADSRLPDLAKSVDLITKGVLALSQSVSENIADVGELRAMAARFARIADLPAGGRGDYATVVDLARTVGSLDLLLDLVEEYAAAKARRGLVEYSDQVALALEVVRSTPRVAEELRTTYRVVLLDEYQDTNVVQSWLLAELFAGHPVMAVGDPNQSIFGWRGASSANLEQFSTQFGTGKLAVFSLPTSWRNGTRILEAANAMVAPLLAETRIPLPRLEAGPTASSLPIQVRVHETLAGEAEAAALWLKERLDAARLGGLKPPTAAMLFRTRKTLPVFMAALRAHGIPFHVLGVAGLTSEPEIADLISALTVLHDPTAGGELVRLLAGSRWRIGVRDLRALADLASWLDKRDYAQQLLADEVRERLRASVADGEGGSIVEALDFLASAKPDHGLLEGFSAIGAERLRHAGQMLARLRSRAGLDLVDLVTLVQQELNLDIEVIANDYRPLGGANMEALFDAIGNYLDVDDAGSLGGFLGWLREAEWRESLAPRPEDPEAGAVQLLTIHGAKGLEWDSVVVPRMVEEELPGRPLDGLSGWLSFGALPWPFRGDAAELPEFLWELAQTRRDVLDSKAEFVERVRHRHVLEERRLAYVAVTRARHSLLLSGSFWATQARPRTTSRFLLELVEAGVTQPVPLCTSLQENPLGQEVNELVWPLDPLGSRRAAVEAAAAAVRQAEPRLAGAWAGELAMLLVERERRLAGPSLVPLPSRVPASRFKDFVSDPAAVARSLRRPMPERPYRATRLGTDFHAWVENRYGRSGGADELAALAGELDVAVPDLASAELSQLQATFEASPWASRKPIEVEREIHLPFDGQIVICKIDAVYSDGDRYQLVDWKTGKVPTTAAELEDRQLQLALYRLAYAQWRGIDAALIDAVFYYVSDDAIIAPERIYDEAELVALWRSSVVAAKPLSDLG